MSAVRNNRTGYRVEDRPPWIDPVATQELRDDADDFEDELIAEMRRHGKIEEP